MECATLSVMRKITILMIGIVAFGLIIFGIWASHNAAPINDGEFKIAATIFPLQDIAQNIVGESGAVQLVLPSGASPHLFEFSPSVLRRLQGVDVIFAIGHGLDDWVESVGDAIGAKIVIVDGGVALRKTALARHAGAEPEGGPVDPHYWLNFENARLIAGTIARELVGRDPQNALIYEENVRNYSQALAAEEQTLQAMTRVIQNRRIISFHDAWYYFADNFGLEIVGTFEPSAGTEPAPRYLAELLRAIKEHGVETIFSEPQLLSPSLTGFTRENNLTVAILDPLGGGDGRESYLKLMEYNVKALLEAVQE